MVWYWKPILLSQAMQTIPSPFIATKDPPLISIIDMVMSLDLEIDIGYLF